MNRAESEAHEQTEKNKGTRTIYLLQVHSNLLHNGLNNAELLTLKVARPAIAVHYGAPVPQSFCILYFIQTKSREGNR